MDLNKLALSLSNAEKKILSVIDKSTNIQQILSASAMDELAARRALQWLENKELIKTDQNIIKSIVPGKNGKNYIEKGLPEKIFLRSIKDSPKKLSEIPLDKDELNVCLGLLKSKGAISIRNDNGLIIGITEPGKIILGKESLEEKFLKTLPRAIDSLAPEEKFAFDSLTKRKNIVEIQEKKDISASLTELGNQIKQQKTEETIEKLTPEIIKNSLWKKKQFKHYDIKSKTPTISGGKKHIIYQAVEYIRRIWLELGFTEMKGNYTQLSFWNFDALFTAQDHPVRELHDTFYLKDPSKGTLPNKEIVERVKASHENGWTTGSKGWQYKWQEEDAKRNVMRTHTTCLSARTIASLKESQLPGKYFSVARNFRNETLDWKHGFEFYQVEGIVIGKDVSFRQLLGYLKEYYKKLGYDKVRFRPSYFPYTEMSVESEVFHPIKKAWMELGGAGMLRPEVVKPLLGKDIPVLAWGQGMERGIMEHIGINDLRQMYANDIELLKKTKMWLK